MFQKDILKVNTLGLKRNLWIYMKNKIVGVYRIKNEERWIAKSLESISDICSEVVILDDAEN